MSDHAVMRMEDLRPDDFDDIDDSTIEVHEARPVRGDQVTTKLVVPLTHDDANALDDAAELDGKTIFEAARDAIRAYADERLHRERSVPHRRAG